MRGNELEEKHAVDFTEDVKRLSQIDVIRLSPEELSAVEQELLALPQETLETSAELTYRMAVIQVEKGDLISARRWQSALIGQRRGTPEGTPRRCLLENRIFCLNLLMTANDNTNLLLTLSIMKHEFGSQRIPLARLSATNGAPSVLRGARDLSFLTPWYSAAAAIVKPLLTVLLEEDGEGVCDVGIANLLYLRNDINGASLQVARAIHVDSAEIAFAALTQMAWIGAVDNLAKPTSAEILDHIEGLLETKNAHWLRGNFQALRARFAALRGDTDQVGAWVEECGVGDLDGCVPRSYYLLITKARCYLSLGEYRAAASLFESLLSALQSASRPLDMAECLVGSAIALEQLGSRELALNKLEQALLTVQDYGYVRIFADYGRQAFLLLSCYGKESAAPENLNAAFLKKAIEAAGIYATLWPKLIAAGSSRAPEEAAELTTSEIQILQLLSEGKTNKELSHLLNISLSTVKFHIANVFEKLQAANRTEAVGIARERGLIG